ncbi:MAG: primosomal protein N' [Acidobacteria bacterium]|nr:primosomal protein N' [Acidobacteriota bacterium]
MARKPAGTLMNVAVLAAMREPLTYRVPSDMTVRVGQRVQVPLGNRKAVGVAVEPVARVAAGVKIREILKVLDPEAVLTPELLTLGLWIAEYYLAPVGEVFRAMLPLRSETHREKVLALTEKGRARLGELESSLLEEARGSEEARFLSVWSVGGESVKVSGRSLARRFPGRSIQIIQNAVARGFVEITEVRRERARRAVWSVRLAGPALPERPQKLSPVARRILEALARQGPADDHRELLKSSRATLAHLKKLSGGGFLELGEPPRASLASSETTGENGRDLTSEQAQALDELTRLLESQKFEPVLLHGVTASGKTEVYLRLIARCLDQGRTALMLVPEIALTPGVQAQFHARFGNQVEVLHSSLGENLRHDAWWAARRGQARVVLGTRSAVFAPLDSLGVIIVDEEHESSYKQEETPRYHARDAAVVRGRLAQALVVLGSATPSLESYSNAREGKYRLLKLEERVRGRPLAAVEIIDMRLEFRETHTQVPLSRQLLEAMEAELACRRQIMVLINRRGYSWFLLCRACGESVRCVNCSISLTYHRREHRLICHYCGYTALVPSHCPGCGSEYLQYVGEGTEKVEGKIAEMFPQARVARLDRDVARRAGAYQKILGDFRDGKIDILVGTQLIAKGHDFHGVTLVGVVSADQGLSMPDFRAAERTFQLLTQVAGRAGRGDSPGRVLVQTFYPDHYAILLAAGQDYEGFYSKEMRFRRMMHYPPAGALANVIAQSTKLEDAARVARQIGGFLGRMAEQYGLRVLGPASAPLARIEGRYRIQLLIKAQSRARLNEVLRRLEADCDQRGVPPHAVMIDMDPVNIL